MTGAIWVLSGNALAMALRLLFLALLARLLNPADFGLAALGATFATFASLFSDAGISNTLVQRTQLDKEHINTAFSFSLGLGLACFLLTILISGRMEILFKMPRLEAVLDVMSLSFVLQALCVVPRALLRRQMKFRTLAIVDFLAFNVGYGITACILAWLHFGVWALIIGITVNNAFAAGLLYVLAPHELSVRIHRLAFKEIIGTSSGFSIAAAANLVALQADNLIVGRFLGAEALGYYSRAYQLMTIPANALGQVTSYVVFPVLSYIQNDRSRLQRAFIRGTLLSAWVGLPASVLVTIYSPEIVQVLFGHKWLPITGVLGILALGTYFRLGYKLPSTMLQASGFVGTSAIIQCIYAGCVVIGALISVRFGLEALAGCILVSVGIVFLLANYQAAKVLHIPGRTILRVLAIPAAMSVPLAAVNWEIVRSFRTYGLVLLTAGAGVLASTAIVLLALVVPRVRNALLSNDT